MIVVYEVREPVIDALMVRHMRVGRMNAHRLGHDLGQRPLTTQQLVIDAAPSFLIAREESLFELRVKVSRLLTAIFVRHGFYRHRFYTP